MRIPAAKRRLFARCALALLLVVTLASDPRTVVLLSALPLALALLLIAPRRLPVEALPALVPGLAESWVRRRRLRRRLRDGEAEDRRLLLWQAHHDTLTKLPNLNLLSERLGRYALAARSRDEIGALVSVDLDGFGTVNDSLTYRSGDLVLTEVARRLALTVRESDTVARVGGDRFAVLLAPLTTAAEGGDMARAIFERLTQAYDVEGSALYLTASIGVTMLPVAGAGVGELLQRADAACGAAKEAGGNRLVFFEPAFNERAHRRFAVESALREALVAEQLGLSVQPIIEVATNRLVAFEALLRWQHPQLGAVSPAEFVPIAEDSGEIVPIGLWAVREVLKLLDSIARSGWGDIRISVNISPRQLRSAADVAQLLQALRAPATRQLTIEITESLLLEDHQLGLDFLTQARALGARIALDDFGAGYSSISYLRDYSFDLLKIDRGFVRRIATEPANRGIVAGIVALGQAMALDVIAEGVESAEDLEALRRLGCSMAQGYLFSKPMPAGQLEPFLRDLRSAERPWSTDHA
ncbi:MAG: bifunctional diguanylate cyclase/phosphodiesterase [Pseudomonadota bacterium]